MRSTAGLVILATAASAQYSSDLLPSNPGGAIPANVVAPSTTGFSNATIQPARGGLAVCVTGFVPIQASTNQNLKFQNFELPKNQSQVTETFLKMVTGGSTFTQEIMGGMQSVNGSWEIGATLCVPGNNTKPEQVQVLTQGVGYDRYYWDFAPGYSWVDVAAQYDHATFFYDRLSVGQSSKPDALNVAQAPLELEILHQFVSKLKSGYFSDTTFSQVVGVGHSYGSALTEGLTSQYPADLDAAILTGYSVNSTAMPTFLQGLNFELAAYNQPYRFASAPPGYIVSSSAISNQIGFFKAPGFDPTILNLAEATKGTVTFGEFFSLMSVQKPAMNYTKPVAIVNGAADLPFCFGNCSYPTNQAEAALKMMYPSTTKTGTYFAQDAGHGVNLHYSAVQAYHFAQDFLNSNL